MWFSDKVSTEFVEKVKAIAKKLDMIPEFMMAVMSYETSGTFSPSIKNPLSTATGLIQFMAATANSLGTSTDMLSKMSAITQLDYVEKYFAGQIKTYGKLQTLENTYLAVFYPAAIKHPLTWVFPAPVYAVNKGFDIDKNGNITKQEVSDTLYNYVKKKVTLRQSNLTPSKLLRSTFLRVSPLSLSLPTESKKHGSKR